jgi:hypothetical protein
MNAYDVLALIAKAGTQIAGGEHGIAIQRYRLGSMRAFDQRNIADGRRIERHEHIALALVQSANGGSTEAKT